MTCPTLRRRVRAAMLLLLLLAAGGSTGCGDLLDASDPTAILENDVNDAGGAELLRRGALTELYGAVGPSAWLSGALADEFLFQPSTFSEQNGIVSDDERLDRRGTGAGGLPYLLWQQLRMRAAPVALGKLQAYAPPGVREAHVGEMFAVRGYAAMRLAEDFCPGFPLHEIVDYKLVYGPPRSTEQVFEYALTAFDSAVSWAADSARVLNFARVGRARTLLNLGRFTDAAAAITDVPTGYVYQTEYNATVARPSNAELAAVVTSWGIERSVADREGGTGLAFVSAQDPRVKTTRKGTARNGATGLYSIDKYPSLAAPIVLASGVEARLIEAEVALQANPGNPQWLTILNTLRTNGTYTTRRNAQDTTKTDTLWNAGSGNVAGLAPLADPGTEAARVDLLFRERAFWLFATGHRLADLRRLIRLYARASESVFPTGAYWRGGAYGSATSLSFSSSEMEYSPGVTGCTGG